MQRSTILLGLAVIWAAAAATPVWTQTLPLAPVRGSDQAVWPAFEGWYENEDGSLTVYFGYHNRNTEEVVDIPLGENNFIEPAEFDGAQPTRFETGRQWGVFGFRVPGDYPRESRIYWNLIIDGETYRVPGHLNTDWKTDALGGGASGNTPPSLTFGSTSDTGPVGPTFPETLTAQVGEPLDFTVHASDQGSGGGLAAAFGGGGRGRAGARVTLDWFKHQGPGAVSFSPERGRVQSTGEEMTTVATFSAPGDYVVRVRATDGGMASAGHAQCCWTHGYINVTVTR